MRPTAPTRITNHVPTNPVTEVKPHRPPNLPIASMPIADAAPANQLRANRGKPLEMGCGLPAQLIAIANRCPVCESIAGYWGIGQLGWLQWQPSLRTDKNLARIKTILNFVDARATSRRVF
ncbi:MAG: hypothetical protein AAFY20_24570 [Cyanobacteria bacterium J06639_14]